MNLKKSWFAPLGAGALAFGLVTAGSGLENEAAAANHDWSYGDECWSGCSMEETDEYFRNGSYYEEVRVENGTMNREEMLELTEHSQWWCGEMMWHMTYKRPTQVNAWTNCEPEYPTLGH